MKINFFSESAGKGLREHLDFKLPDNCEDNLEFFPGCPQGNLENFLKLNTDS